MFVAICVLTAALSQTPYTFEQEAFLQEYKDQPLIARNGHQIRFKGETTELGHTLELRETGGEGQQAPDGTVQMTKKTGEHVLTIYAVPHPQGTIWLPQDKFAQFMLLGKGTWLKTRLQEHYAMSVVIAIALCAAMLWIQWYSWPRKNQRTTAAWMFAQKRASFLAACTALILFSVITRLLPGDGHSLLTIAIVTGTIVILPGFVAATHVGRT